MYKVLLLILFLTFNLHATSKEGLKVIKEINEYDLISKVENGLDLRIAEIELIYAIKAWEDNIGIRYSYGLKTKTKIFILYRRLIELNKIT